MTVTEISTLDRADKLTHEIRNLTRQDRFKEAREVAVQAIRAAEQRGHRKGQEEMRTRGKSDLLEKAEWWRQQNYEPSADAFECAAEFVGNIPLEGDTP